MTVENMDAYYSGEFEGPRVNVGRAERWLSLAAGGVLAAYGARRRDLQGGLAAATGAVLLYRGATGHCPVNERVGRDTAHGNTRERLAGPRGVLVRDVVVIRRPVHEVYRFWRDFENLPRFMNHLESVAVRENGLSHWVAKGPAGTSVEWDARVINEIEDELIGWQSLEGSDIATAGSVRFEEAPTGTRVRVRFRYDPPAGRLGNVVANLLGEKPSQQVREDLRQLKAVLENPSIA